MLTNKEFPYKKVLVTGGAGFLGKFIVKRLREFPGVEVFVPRSAEFDLTREDAAIKLLEQTKPDLVIHAAGVIGGIGYTRSHPATSFYGNLMLGVNILENAHRTGVKKFVGVGTVCAYPKFTPVPFREENIWDGYPEETNAPYGLAKKMMLVHGQALRQQFGFNAIHLLLANLYGVGDDFHRENSHVIPALIRKCDEARREGRDFIEVWGTGSASREFLYVEDAAEAIVRAAWLYDEGEPVNVGAGREIPIKNLVEMIAEIIGFRGEIRWDANKPDGQPRRCLDVSRAEEKFGFRAKTGFEEGLRKTFSWYSEMLETNPAALEKKIK